LPIMSTGHPSVKCALPQSFFIASRRVASFLKGAPATKVGFAVVAGLPDDLRAKLVEEMAPVLRVARNPELAHQLEGPVASELGEWLAICDLAGQGKND